MKSGYLNIAALDRDVEELLGFCLSIHGRVDDVFPKRSSPLFPARPVVNFEVGAIQNFKLHFDGDGWAEGVRDTAVRPHISVDCQGVVRNQKCERLPVGRVYCSAVFLPNRAIKSAWGLIKKYLKREFPPYIGEDSPVLIHLGKEAAQWLKAPDRGLLIYEPDYEKFRLPRPTVAGD